MRLALLSLLFIGVILLSPSTAHAVTVKVSKDVNISGSLDPTHRQQAETSVAIDPRNPDIIVVGVQDYRLLASGGHRWDAIYRSTDGGKTWSFSFLPGFPGDNSTQGQSSPLQGERATTDPVVAFDGLGNLYYAGVTTRLRLFVAKYVNDAANYSFTTLICPIACVDKPWIAVDTSGGPDDGNVYVTAQGCSINNGGNRNCGQSGLLFYRSVDGGLTFQKPLVISRTGTLSGVAVDPSGRVFVSGLETNGTSIANIIVSKSTDGGASFGNPVIAVLGVTSPGTLPGNLFRTFPIPQIVADDQGVYVVSDDFGTGDSNVMFTRSLDAATTWSTPIIVNDLATYQQFFPSIAVSAGTISVIWYDSRLGQLANGTITGLDVFYASSTDLGASFSSSVRITSASFNPNIVERADFNDTQPFIGDYIQVAASSNVVHPVWTDNRNACDNIVPIFGCTDQDTYTATITL